VPVVIHLVDRFEGVVRRASCGKDISFHADRFTTFRQYEVTCKACLKRVVPIGPFEDKISVLENEVNCLKACRIAYASEFDYVNGEPDVGNIHTNIRELKAENAALKKKLQENK